MKKILRIIESADPKKGGPIFGLLESTKILRARGYSVDIITLDSPAEAFLNSVELKNIIALGPNHTKLAYTPNLKNWLSKNVSNYDLATIHGVWQWNSLGSYKQLNKYNVPYVIFPHGSLDVWDSNLRKVSWILKKIYFKFFESKVLNNSSAILFTSSDELKNSTINFNLPINKCRIIKYGVPSLTLDEDNRLINIDKKNSYLLFLSRIHKKKGVERLLQAFSESKLKQNYKLKIAGTGDYNYIDSLRLLVSNLNLDNKVEFVGHVSGDLKRKVLEDAALFILPSYQENFGLAVAESLSLATPVAISNNVNIWQGVEKHNAGYVYNNSTADLITTLNDFYDLSRADYTEMCCNARSCFQLEFDIERFVDDIENIYKEFNV